AICSDCSPSTFVTITRTGRISDLRRGHLRAEFVPKLRVESFHRGDSEGCTIVTIERHSPDRFFDRSFIYICALHAHASWPPPESSCCIEPIIVCLLHQEPPRLGSRLKFSRTTRFDVLACTVPGIQRSDARHCRLVS